MKTYKQIEQEIEQIREERSKIYEKQEKELDKLTKREDELVEQKKKALERFEKKIKDMFGIVEIEVKHDNSHIRVETNNGEQLFEYDNEKLNYKNISVKIFSIRNIFLNHKEKVNIL